MDEQDRAPTQGASPDQPVPGDRPPAARAHRRLERPPGERYVGGPATATRSGRPTTAPSGATGIVAVIATVAGGAVLVGILGSFDLGPGLAVLALFIGWAVALSVIWAMPIRDEHRRWARPVLAAALAAGSVAGGLLLLWAWALAEGGVLGPIAYADARFGLLAPILLVAAAAVAAVRAR